MTSQNDSIKRDYYNRHKEAIKARARARYYANREKIKEQVKEYAKSNPARCKEYKRKYYESNKVSVIQRAKEWKSAHQEKTKASNAKYRQNNKEQITAARQKWIRDNPDKVKSLRHRSKAVRRSRLRVGHDNHRVISDWVKKWKNRNKVECFWCRCKFRGDDMHIDHVVPISKGGLHCLQNLVTSCAKCNQRKSARNPEEFNRRSHAPRLFV